MATLSKMEWLYQNQIKGTKSRDKNSWAPQHHGIHRAQEFSSRRVPQNCCAWLPWELHVVTERSDTSSPERRLKGCEEILNRKPIYCPRCTGSLRPRETAPYIGPMPWPENHHGSTVVPHVPVQSTKLQQKFE